MKWGDVPLGEQWSEVDRIRREIIGFTAPPNKEHPQSSSHTRSVIYEVFFVLGVYTLQRFLCTSLHIAYAMQKVAYTGTFLLVEPTPGCLREQMPWRAIAYYYTCSLPLLNR